MYYFLEVKHHKIKYVLEYLVGIRLIKSTWKEAASVDNHQQNSSYERGQDRGLVPWGV